MMAAARKLTVQKLLLLCMLNALADDTEQAGTKENHYKAGLNIGKRIDGKQHWFYIPPTPPLSGSVYNVQRQFLAVASRLDSLG